MHADKKSLSRDLSQKAPSAMECFLPTPADAGHSMPPNAGHSMPPNAGQKGLGFMQHNQGKNCYGYGKQDDAKHFQWCDHGGFQGTLSSTI